MHSASVRGVGNKSICEMNVGCCEPSPFRNSIFVAVNAVALTCFVPFTNTSAVLPFHLMAIFTVSVVVINKFDKVPPTLLYIANLDAVDEPFLIANEFVESVVESPIPIGFATPSRTNTKFSRNSTNQVPPLDVIKPLVYILFRLKASATLVALDA